MNSKPVLHPRSFPARIAELGFTADLPADWITHELPTEELDFSDPTAFAPLAVVTATHSAIVFAFAARPAHDDGTLHDWAWYHLNHHQLRPRAIGADVIAGVAAMTGEATQDSDLGPLVVRFAFLEDGGRLINLTLTAPELLAAAVVQAWFGMLRSFQLETPQGSRFEIEEHAADGPAAPIPEPWLDPAEEPAPPPELMENPPPVKRTFRDFALEDDTTSLDPETSINANLRDRGAGLTPDVVAAHDEQKRATVAAGAIMAQFDVPYGWHVIDDGQRTLVFEPGGKVQINLNLIEPKPADASQDGQPAWWHRALELEAQGKLTEAEQTIRDGCPYIGFAASTAEMYRLRMVRLQQAGDAAGAREAFGKSSDFIFCYAGMATSGGEGAALSLERDQFRAQLVAEYGSDPEEEIS